MKLIRLKVIEAFRSLQAGFEINFHKEQLSQELTEFHPFCLVGLNGSGKSNVLEALASIFYHLECCTGNYPDHAFSKFEGKPDAYELEYFILNDSTNTNLSDLIRVKIFKIIGGAPKMSINDADAIEVSKNFGLSCLPDLVVAYSSGENETLSLPFVKTKLFQYDEYLRDFMVTKAEYEKPKSSLLYIDYEMSQAVLLTILLFFDFEKNGDKDVLLPLNEELRIKGIQQFTINLKNDWQTLISDDDTFIEANTIYVDEADGFERKKHSRILDHLEGQIKKLEACATCSYIKDEFKSLDFWVDLNTKELIREKFDHDPYKFFSIFQMLQSLNERVENISEKMEIYDSRGYYTDYKRPEYPWFFYFTNYFIKQESRDSNDINNLLLKQLSDGEQQFLHTLGICLMLKNKRTLLLLDEPETHFNPDWRSKFINILRKTLKAGGDNFLMKDIVLTSHSPFIISDCLPDKVIQFKKTASGVVAASAEELNFKTFGASVDYILQKFFGVKSLVSEYSRSWISEIIKVGSDNELREAIDFVGESDLKQFLFQELFKRNKNVNS